MISEDAKAYINKSMTGAGAGQEHVENALRQSVSFLDSTIHHQFEILAQQIPDETALVLPDLPHGKEISESLTYSELNRRADILSEQLLELGVKPDQFIAVFMDRSIEMIVALLGILKAGAAYVPLDPAYPMEKLSFMLEDTHALVLITQSHLVDSFPPHNAHILRMDSGWGTDKSRPDPGWRHRRSATSRLAYINYTSGSTGKPKGVVVPHRGVLRLVNNPNYATLDDTCNILQLAPVSFDAATLEIWGALLNGGRCVLFPYNGIPDPRDLEYVIQKTGITTLWLTASLFNAVIDIHPEALRGVRELLTGGEALSVEHVRKAQKSLPGTQLINGYGPTESTTFTCCYRIPGNLGEDLTSIPIGYPINHTKVYVLDEKMQPKNNGDPGELYIGGDGLAIGYLNRPELTSEKFVPDPFDENGRLYKSGDLVRYLPEGEIEFMGRLDDQIKISGFRVELGEIESNLKKHDAVREAVVLVDTDKAGSKYLIGYVTLNSGKSTNAEGLKDYLKQKLASFMIPRELMILPRIPLNPNGKVDRNAMPKPGSKRSDPTVDFVPAHSETEKTLAAIWCEVLGIDQVGIRDNFFDIGGTSLLSVKIISKIREILNIDVPIVRIYHYPTIELMANFISRGKQTGAYAEAMDRAQKQRTALARRKQAIRRRK
jgi:amino acid adenylation domain-containing protein